MKKKFYTLAIYVMMIGVTGIAQVQTDPFYEFIKMETAKLELEKELFGFKNYTPEIVSIRSIQVYEPEEELDLDFDTRLYLPTNFNPYKGMNKLDWTIIPLYELEEDLDY